MDETTLGWVESVDVLWLLEDGHDLRLVETEYETAPVDTPEDHERVDATMAEDNCSGRAGELPGGDGAGARCDGRAVA